MQSLLEREAHAYWCAIKCVRMNTQSQNAVDEARDELSLIAHYTKSEMIRRDYSRLIGRRCVSSA